MSQDIQEPTPYRWFSILAITLAYVAIAVPVGAFFLADSFPYVVVKAEDGTAGIIHMLAVQTFSIILTVSTVINAIVVTIRRRVHPATYIAPLRLPLWVGLLFVLELSWIIELATSRGLVTVAEPIISLAIAAASIVTCVMSAKRDERSQRFALASAEVRRTSALPKYAKIRGMRRGLIGTAIVLATVLVAVFVTASVTPTTHTHCQIDGKSYGDGTEYVQVLTTNCGDFALPGGNAAYSSLHVDDIPTYTIVSRGWSFDFPLRRVIVSMMNEKG